MGQKFFGILGMVTLLWAPGLVQAQDGESFGGFGSSDNLFRFVDEDGDGFNDLAPDDDEDGIPNGLDPDYSPAALGEGQAMYSYGLGGIFSRMFEMAWSFQGSDMGPMGDPGMGSGMATGPGMNSGFGPGGEDASAQNSGEGQANRAGRRGNRK